MHFHAYPYINLFYFFFLSFFSFSSPPSSPFPPIRASPLPFPLPLLSLNIHSLLTTTVFSPQWFASFPSLRSLLLSFLLSLVTSSDTDSLPKAGKRLSLRLIHQPVFSAESFSEHLLQSYDVYHARYLDFKCFEKHNTDYFNQCCHPLLVSSPVAIYSFRITHALFRKMSLLASFTTATAFRLLMMVMIVTMGIRRFFLLLRLHILMRSAHQRRHHLYIHLHPLRRPRRRLCLRLARLHNPKWPNPILLKPVPLLKPAPPLKLLTPRRPRHRLPPQTLAMVVTVVVTLISVACKCSSVHPYESLTAVPVPLSSTRRALLGPAARYTLMMI